MASNFTSCLLPSRFSTYICDISRKRRGTLFCDLWQCLLRRLDTCAKILGQRHIEKHSAAWYIKFYFPHVCDKCDMLDGTIRAQGKCTSDLLTGWRLVADSSRSNKQSASQCALPLRTHVPAEVTASDPEMEDHEDPDEEAPTLLSGGLSAWATRSVPPCMLNLPSFDFGIFYSFWRLTCKISTLDSSQDSQHSGAHCICSLTWTNVKSS